MDSRTFQAETIRPSEPIQPWNRRILERALPAYEIGEVFGRGAHGFVVAARHRQLERDVAVKLLAPSVRFDDTLRARFESEARLLATLEHPHIVCVYDFVQADDAYLLVMERLAGGTAKARLGPHGLPPRQACAIVLAVCRGLHHAHGKGVLHRDVKPENLLFSSAGVPKVADFGIAKLLDTAAPQLTRSGWVVGTPSYMAPEQIEGRAVGPHTDVYATGTVLYELLCGALPFAPTDDLGEALKARLGEQPPSPHERAGDVPAEVGAVTMQALAADPERRFAGADELAGALQRAAARAWGTDWVSDSGVVVHGLGRAMSTTPPPQRAPAPPAPPTPRVSGNLPAPPAALVGRERELREVCELLRAPGGGVVTLTGPGGTGKTRLALQVGAEMREEFADGVFFVSLAPLADANLVLPTLAQILGVVPAPPAMASYLAQKDVLLILDNMEQVVAARAQLAELLAQAPGVRLLVTSREPLRLRAERRYPVPPLTVPGTGRFVRGGDPLRHSAIELFVERACAVAPDFVLDDGNATAVAELCRRVDGLPLAIELAAARTALLSPEAILARLDERFSVLSGGPVDLPERHQALQATIAWSYDLLEPAERRLFARLGIHAGGFDLDAAAAVCDAELDELGALVAKSLVTRTGGERFDMLETIRAFALQQLADEAETLGERHARYYLDLAEELYPQRWRHEREVAERMEREHDNFRAALAWLQDRDGERYARLASALGWLWHVHSHFAEGREHLRRALAVGPPDGPLRARLLASAGELAAWSGDGATALPLLAQAAELWDELGEPQEAVFALQDLGWMYFFGGAAEQSRATMERALELQRAAGDEYLVNRAQVLVLQTLIALGEVEVVERLGGEALALAERLGDRRSVQYTQHFLADCPLIRGDCAAAQERYLAALRTAVQLGDRIKIAAEIQGVAMAAAGLSRPRRALVLAGGAAAEMNLLGVDLSTIGFWTALLDRYLGMARTELGAEQAAAAWGEGERAGFDRILEQALDVG